MSFEKGKISGSQLVFSLIAFIQGSILLTSFTTNLTKQNTWIVVVAAFIISIPFSIIFSLLAKRFFTMNLIQILNEVYGVYIGTILSIFYIFDFILDLFYNVRDLGDFYITFLITDTHISFFIIVFVLVCAYVINKGIEPLVHVSHIFCTISFIIVVGTFLLLIKNMDFSNFLPILEIKPIKLIQGIHIMSIISFGDTIVFFSIMPVLKDTKHIVRNNLIGLLIGCLTLLIITIRNTAVLGISESIMVSPSFEANRLIDIGSIFTRMDILIAIGNTLMMFFKCSIIYYSTVVCISEVFRLRTYKPMILPTGGIAIIGAIIIFVSVLDHAAAGQGYVMIYKMLTVYILPPMTLLIAHIRKL